MQNAHRQLGEITASEALIFELYIDLRRRINDWASITRQTAQARMGYVGQHLTSVVTGFPGGRSGARGRDLVLPDGEYAEIKTCYRVDQLGKCNSCDARVASIELHCPECESADIKRNDDSKWLIGIRHDEEFATILEPASYFLVLFDFVDLSRPNTIRASIWEVDPKNVGFAFCIVDYRLNIQTKSISGAPFNLWPYSLKFYAMQPTLIYRSLIATIDGEINTTVFPGRDDPIEESIMPLMEYARSSNLTKAKIQNLAELLEFHADSSSGTKRNALETLEHHILDESISSTVVSEHMARVLYLDQIKSEVESLPQPLKSRVEALM